MKEKEKLGEAVAIAVLKGAAAMCKTTPAEVRGKSRRRFVVEARQLISAILKEGGWGYQEIADFLTYDKVGNHTNSLHWYKMHQQDVKTYNYYRNNFLQLQSVHSENIEEFTHYEGDLISMDLYKSLETKYYILKAKHDSILAENRIIRQSATKLKNQISTLC
jgi:hypothetical protein